MLHRVAYEETQHYSVFIITKYVRKKTINSYGQVIMLQNAVKSLIHFILYFYFIFLLAYQ